MNKRVILILIVILSVFSFYRSLVASRNMSGKVDFVYSCLDKMEDPVSSDLMVLTSLKSDRNEYALLSFLSLGICVLAIFSLIVDLRSKPNEQDESVDK